VDGGATLDEVAALAKAAEQMRDEGSFALLDVSPPIGEWLG
jgi:HAMP domain-containing protein